MAPRQSNNQRKQRLNETAARLIHQQGFAATTLADIATGAQIPAGSIYYYFRNKDDVIAAIVEQRVAELTDRLREFERLSSPKAGIEAVINIWQEDSEVDARYGCPIGSLCYELGKQSGKNKRLAVKPLRVLLHWTEQCFEEMGYSHQAADLALHVISVLQGISLVANALEDPELVLRETKQLREWLGSL